MRKGSQDVTVIASAKRVYQAGAARRIMMG
jgi:hypothetical protein